MAQLKAGRRGAHWADGSVSLGIIGAVVRDALNDLLRLSTGRSALPPLRSSQTLDLIYRLEVQATQALELRLAWDDNQGERQTERLSLHLPAAPLNGAAPEHAEVVQARERLLVAQVQREIARLADLGDLSGASVLISGLQNRLMVEGMRSGVSLQTELQQLADLQARLRRHDRASVSKVARKQSYDKMTGQEH